MKQQSRREDRKQEGRLAALFDVFSSVRAIGQSYAAFIRTREPRVQSQTFSLRCVPAVGHIRWYICCHELAANLESVHFEQRVGVSGISP